MNGHSATSRRCGAWIEVSDPMRLPEKPLVSAVMLAYNHGPHLADAIEGVLIQKTDFPIELVIGEDCSSDNTRAIALRYQREHPQLIRIVTSDRNVGMHENFRRAFVASRGEFIAPCEGDDYWIAPDKLTRQVAYLRANGRVGLVHTGFLYRYGSGFRSSKHLLSDAGARVLDDKEALGELLQGINWTGTCTFLYRRAFLELVLRSYKDFVLGYRLIDYPVMLLASVLAGIGYIDIVTAVHRYMPGSAMNSGHQKRLEMQESMIACRQDFVRLGLVEASGVGCGLRPEELSFLKSLAYLAGDRRRFEFYRREMKHKHNRVDPRDWIRSIVCRSSVALRLVRLRADRQARQRLSRYSLTMDAALNE